LLNDTNDQSVTLMSTFVPANRHQWPIPSKGAADH
jgi:hypothetical protein